MASYLQDEEDEQELPGEQPQLPPLGQQTPAQKQALGINPYQQSSAVADQVAGTAGSGQAKAPRKFVSFQDYLGANQGAAQNAARKATEAVDKQGNIYKQSQYAALSNFLTGVNGGTPGTPTRSGDTTQPLTYRGPTDLMGSGLDGEEATKQRQLYDRYKAEAETLRQQLGQVGSEEGLGALGRFSGLDAALANQAGAQDVQKLQERYRDLQAWLDGSDPTVKNQVSAAQTTATNRESDRQRIQADIDAEKATADANAAVIAASQANSDKAEYQRGFGIDHAPSVDEIVGRLDEITGGNWDDPEMSRQLHGLTGIYDKLVPYDFKAIGLRLAQMKATRHDARMRAFNDLKQILKGINAKWRKPIAKGVGF